MNVERFNKFLKLLRTVRLGWLVPFILLLRGENPAAQFRAILTGVCIPIFAVLMFLLVWNISSSRIVTKFGTVPGPAQVASAWGSLRNESRLEEVKQADHVRRAREKRVRYAEKYDETLASLPGGAPSLGDLESVKQAMDVLSTTFAEIDELLNAANEITVAADELAGQEIVDGFSFESSKLFGKNVVEGLLPLELSYRAAEESLRIGEKFNVVESDTDEVKASKEAARKKEARRLAAEKSTLLIARQQLTTKATRQALGMLKDVPSDTERTLEKFDEDCASLSPRLEAWYGDIEAAVAGGATVKDKVKVKMLNKSFSPAPYPGKDTYIQQIATSLKTVFAGFVIASLIAIPLGIVCGLNKSINNAFNPLIQIFKPVSPLAWLPIVMIVVGALYTVDDPTFELSFINSAITVALCSLWPTLVNTAVGVASTDKDFLNVAKVLRLSWFKRVWKIILPSSLPLVFTGLRLSLGVGWMVLIAAEMLAQNPGLGKFVWDMFQNGSSETLSMIMVAVFTIGIIGFFLDTVMLSLQQLVSFGEREAI